MDHYQQRMEAAQKLRRAADNERNKAVIEMVDSATQMECVTNTIYQDTERAIAVMNQAPAIIHDIHTQFEMATELRGKDLAFLFGAAALQTARWALLPGLDLKFNQVPNSERMSAQEGKNIETAGVKEYIKDHGIDSHVMNDHSFIHEYTWEKLLIAPVPYDAMHGSRDIYIPGIKEIGKEIYSKNHHAATWGHDPVYGWIIGPLNITARMITFRDFQTYHVVQEGDSFNQRITGKTTMSKMLVDSIESWAKDGKRLCASVVKQKLHLQSDKYAKTGLPIPFVDARTAQYYISEGWNSNEVERLFSKAARNLGVIGMQYVLAMTIDQFIKALHLLSYDESFDGPIGAYGIRSQKIVCYSCALAEIANGITAAALRDTNKLDIGGYLNLANEILQSKKLRNQIEAEFLEKELHNRIYGEEYYWEGV